MRQAVAWAVRLRGLHGSSVPIPSGILPSWTQRPSYSTARSRSCSSSQTTRPFYRGRAIPARLETDDRLRSYLEDVLDGLVRAAQVLETIDAELAPELVELRNDLITLRPDADDSDAEPPGSGGAPQPLAFVAYQKTLAYFDEQRRSPSRSCSTTRPRGNGQDLTAHFADEGPAISEGGRGTPNPRPTRPADETADVAADRETSDDPADRKVRRRRQRQRGRR